MEVEVEVGATLRPQPNGSGRLTMYGSKVVEILWNGARKYVESLDCGLADWGLK